MHVFIVGSGKLATELLKELPLGAPFEVLPWSQASAARARSIVVHAGSGRELDRVIAFCEQTGSALIELATESKLETDARGFPVVLCPNTNILMLKLMSMLESSGHLFKDYRIAVTESHQAGKSSTPGTAVSIACSLGLSAKDVVSVRDPGEQREVLRIPAEHLDRHAVHVISIQDTACRISMEARVYGASPYSHGVASIVSAIHSHPLDNRLYAVNEFVERGWV